jgi:glutaminyl-tRNA synthetase
VSDKHDFIRDIIDEDLESGKHDEIVTRFPPEPNGYLHIGHAKSIVLNHGIAEDYDGRFHLRFDDTNPLTEEEEYVESIKRDVAWLGADWGEHLYYASEYFDRMYELAEFLIEKGKAYVDSLSTEEIREYRGDWNTPGEESPYRDRSVEENLELFRGMRDGEFEEGEHILRAKIDMQADNVLMRDPIMYRILYKEHHHVDEDWCIYPMYDYAHCLEDAFEGITHSLCTLEFENNRELYNWFVRETEVEHQPRQIEFGAGGISYTVMSKRRLRQLVERGDVDGWDDPRMPTLSGVRRRGVPPEAIRNFWHEIGVSRNEQTIEVAQFENAIRDTLNTRAPRVLAVEEPLKVVIEGFPEGETDWIEAPHFPHDIPKDESRMIPFTRELYIERDDFREDPPEGYYRLSPGEEVRLRYGYFVTCEEVVRDDEGEIVELRCSYDPETRGGKAPDGREVDGTIHWVSAAHALPCEFRLYDRLFEVRNPVARDEDFEEFLNPESLVVQQGYVEPSVRHASPGTRFQFERNGYFAVEPEEASPDNLIFNQIVPLAGTWEDREAEERRRRAEERAAEKRERKERKKEEAEQAREARHQALMRQAEGSVTDDELETPRGEARGTSPQLRAALERFLVDMELETDDADLLSGDEVLSSFFEDALEHRDEPSEVAGWVVNELLPKIEGEVGTEAFHKRIRGLTFGPEEAADLITMKEEGRITSDAADEVLDQMLETGDDPGAIVDDEGLEAITDEETIRELIGEAMADNTEQVRAYASGDTNLFGFFIGQVMRATGGQADPQLVRQILGEELPEPDEDDE